MAKAAARSRRTRAGARSAQPSFVSRVGGEAVGLLLLGFAALGFLALVTYSPDDATFALVPVANRAGAMGATLAGALVGGIGLGAFAARVLLSGQFIGEFTGTVCDESKLARDNPYVFRLGKGTYL